MAGKLRLALLIDADNVAPKLADPLIAEVTKIGCAEVRRIYGDWGRPTVGAWKDGALKHSLQPIQQSAYVTGKNATDIAMVIDAMDLLHSGRFDGFCLVSNDSDFTRLAIRIREQGLKVFGFGTQVAPPPFVGACDRFVCLDTTLTPVPVPVIAATPTATEAAKKPLTKKIRAAIKAAVVASADKSGWSGFSAIGAHLIQQTPPFRFKEMGYAKLWLLIEATEEYEFDRSLTVRKFIAVRPKGPS